jgi:hypothetical protein
MSLGDLLNESTTPSCAGAGRGLWRKTEGHTDLVDAPHRRLELRLRISQRLPAVIELLGGDASGLEQRHCPIVVGLGLREPGLLRVERGHPRAEQGNLIVDVLDRVVQVESQAAHLPFDSAGLGLRGDEIGLRRTLCRPGNVDLHLSWTNYFSDFPLTAIFHTSPDEC